MSTKKTLLYKEIEILSITDELTSLYNRRFFTSQLGKEMEREMSTA
ncbi:MAG TPA: GGDEF domain-containing protein [Nitrospirae bacterium]|nr:GGDEF domain-containing protein [Nitrospirota bacterium]